MAQQNQQNIFQNSLTEEEPPHPKTFTHIPLRSNNQKINKSNQKDKAINNHIFVKTARQSFKKQQQKSPQRNIYSSRNSRAIPVNAPSNNISPKSQQEQLFIPQRKQLNQPNKYFSQKRSLKQKSTSFHVSSRLKQSDASIKLFQKDKINYSFSNQNSKPISILQNRATIHHLSHLRKYQNTQKQRQIQLNNRLKYFTVQKERDTKRLQFAKRKYEKVVAVRSQFIKEKESIQKRKIVNYIEEMNQKHKKIQRIKQQQQQKKLSISRLSQTKNLEASRLRSEERNNIFQKKAKQISQLQKKQQSVKASQLRQKMTRQKLIKANKSRIDTIRSIENKQIVKNYLNVSQRQKMNQKLQDRFQKEIALISEKRQKSVKLLQKYEEFLGLRTNKPNLNNLISRNNIVGQKFDSLNSNKNYQKPRTSSSVYSTSVSKSFYLTNY